MNQNNGFDASYDNDERFDVHEIHPRPSDMTDHPKIDDLIKNDRAGATDDTSQPAAPVVPPLHHKYFTSYSANCEDVILNRIFGTRTSGFYIDVGAAHPLFENDTKLFYDRGWTGINIEPNPTFFDILASERARDRNFCVAVSDTVGSIDFYDIVGTGLSTCDDKQADIARQKGHQVIKRSVTGATLASILDQVAPSAIDFLKIDVEGLEEQVLASNDWTKYKPSVILLEVTLPETPTRRPTHVRSYLEKLGYRWRYFDGLNDFYVAENFNVADKVFDRPPNIFDGFKPRGLVDLEQEVVTFKNAQALYQMAPDLAALRESYSILQVANNRIKIELANETFERHRLSVAADGMRKELIHLHGELERWIADRDELLHLRAGGPGKVVVQAMLASSSWWIARLYRVFRRVLRASSRRLLRK